MELAGGLVVRPTECHIQANINRLSVAYNKLGLNMVVGSFGVGHDLSPVYLYGNPMWTEEQQFYTKHDPPFMNAHVWLEDDESRVYDIQMQLWQDVADQHNKSLSVEARLLDNEHYRLIEAKTKDELRNQGFHYNACPQHLQEPLLNAFFSWRIEIL